MNMVKLTENGRGRQVLINWDNVDFIKPTANHFGDSYTEVYCGKQTIDVEETLEQIEKELWKLEQQTKEQESSSTS